VRNRPLSLISHVHRPQVSIQTETGTVEVAVGSYGIAGCLAAMQAGNYQEQDAA